MNLRPLLLFAGATFAAVASSHGQSSTPMVVQAMPATPPSTVTPVTAATAQSAQSVSKTLDEIKTTNEAILAKQAATLQQLDELEKVAEQIKIYSKRG